MASSILRAAPLSTVTPQRDLSLSYPLPTGQPQTIPQLLSPFHPQIPHGPTRSEIETNSPLNLVSPQALTGDLERDKMIHSLFYNPLAPALVADRNECYRTTLNHDRRFLDGYEELEGYSSGLLAALVALRPHIRDPVSDKFSYGTRQGSIGVGVRIEGPFVCRYGYNLAIGTNVTIEAHCKIIDTCTVVIGDGVHLGLGTMLNCDCDTRASNRQVVGRGIVLEEGCWIGPGVTILAGVRVGKSAKVLAGSVVFENIAEYCVVGGNPAKVVGRVQSYH